MLAFMLAWIGFVVVFAAGLAVGWHWRGLRQEVIDLQNFLRPGGNER